MEVELERVIGRWFVYGVAVGGFLAGLLLAFVLVMGILLWFAWGITQGF